MPLPMIHFSVAVKFFENEEIPASFLLGSIAPDSIHMRKNTNREDKKFTHLDIENGDSNMALIQETYRKYIVQNSEEEWKWFVKGYFAHLLTDYNWLHNVYFKFKEKVIEDNMPADQIRRAYYQDTDQIDFNFYKKKGWTCDVWNKLIDARTFGFEPYLSADEINFWRLRTIHWFDLVSKEPGIAPKYITELMVEDFIIKAADKVKTIINEWDRKIIEDFSKI